MIFNLLLNIALLSECFLLSVNQHKSSLASYEAFGDDYYSQTSLFLNSHGPTVADFCDVEAESLLGEYEDFYYMKLLVILWTLGSLTTLSQRLLTLRFKDNVQLGLADFVELVITLLSGILFIVASNESDLNSIVSDKCSEYIELS